MYTSMSNKKEPPPMKNENTVEGERE